MLFKDSKLSVMKGICMRMMRIIYFSALPVVAILELLEIKSRLAQVLEG